MRILPTEQVMGDVVRLMREQKFETIEEANAFLEKTLAGGGRAPRAAETALDRAQDLMYQAWEAAKPQRRVDLALAAIAESRDCADGFVLLAEEGASSAEEALGFYTLGVLAGERALEAKTFADHAGHFWGLLETRPYMRARLGVAQTLWDLGQTDEAISHYRELLRLNENDNQGVRYLLAAAMAELHRDSELETLLDTAPFSEDVGAAWGYTRALVEFRRTGAGPDADGRVAEALRRNPHVPDYLTGRKAMPKTLPDTIGFGDPDEAVAYAAEFGRAWRDTPGGTAWLGRLAGSRRTAGRRGGRKRR